MVADVEVMHAEMKVMTRVVADIEVMSVDWNDLKAMQAMVVDIENAVHCTEM